jgi:6-phosphofructokinase 1
VVVAEGATPVPGTFELPEYPVDERGFIRYGGIAQALAPEIERLTGYETRVTVLGHVQRGGTPCADDRVLATRFGIGVVDLVDRGAWGTMVGISGNEVVEVPLAEAAKVRPVPGSLYRAAEVFF